MAEKTKSKQAKIEDCDLKQLHDYFTILTTLYDYYVNQYEMNKGNVYGNAMIPEYELSQIRSKIELYKVRRIKVLNEIERRLENVIFE